MSPLIRPTARRSTLLALFVCVASTAQAQIATLDWTIDPPGYPRQLAVTQDGSILGVEGAYVRKYSASWSVLLELFNSDPGVQPGDFEYALGGLELPDGRLLVADAGGVVQGTWIGSRFAVLSASGQFLSHWPIPQTPVMSPPRLAANGDIYMAGQSSGVTTIRRWSSAGAPLGSWSVTTTGALLVIRDDVVYLGGDSRKVLKFSLDGTPLGEVPHANLGQVRAMAVDGAGRIYQLVYSNGAKFLVLLAANGSRIGVQNSVDLGNWSAPNDLLLVNDRTLYVADVSWGYGAVHQLTVTAEVVPARSMSWGRVKALYR